MESGNEDNPARKRRRDSDDPGGGAVVSPIDYISDLPESVILYILSLLPTKYAVRSSLLSRNWRHRWTQLTSFDFEYHCLPLRETSMSFVEFVNMVLHKTAAESINRFRLRRETQELGAITVNRWISTAIARNCRVLDLDISFPGGLPLDTGEEDIESDGWGEIHLTGAIYSCATLEVLRLRGCFYIEVSDPVCLPRLAVLELFNVLYYRKEGLGKLIAACPVLETLTIEREDFDCMVVCSICSPTLKRLRIHCNDDFDGEEEEGVYNVLKLEMNCPALEYLYLHDIVTRTFSIEGLTLVTEMDLHVSPLLSVEDGAIAGLVRAFDRAKFLKFSREAMKALGRATKILTTTSFEKVTKLVVDINSSHWSHLVDLIDRCIKLEVLEMGCLGSNMTFWNSPVRAPRCFSSSLRQVTLRPFNGFEDELSMLKVFLDHGLVLETVNLCSFGFEPDDYKARFHLLNKVSKMPRASKNCKISDCAWFEDLGAVEWDEEW